MMRRDIYVYAFPPSKKAKPRLPSFSFIFPCQIAEHWESIHHRETPVTARIILSPSSPWNPRNLCMEFIDLFPSHCYYFNGSSCMHLCVGGRLSFLLHLLIQLGFVNCIQMRVLKITRSPFNLLFCEEKKKPNSFIIIESFDFCDSVKQSPDFF